MAEQYKDECEMLADELTRAYGLASSTVVRGAAQFFVKYYGVVDAVRDWTCFASRSEVLQLVDEARHEKLIPWRLPNNEVSILTVSVYGLKVTDQMMSEPPLMREPLYAVASFNCVQEAEGHFVLLVKTGDPDTGEFFAHVIEIPDEARAAEICTLIERTIAEAFKQAHPFKESDPVDQLPPAPPLPPRVYDPSNMPVPGSARDSTIGGRSTSDFAFNTGRSSVGSAASNSRRRGRRSFGIGGHFAGGGSKKEKSRAAIVEETAAFKPVQASQGAVGDMASVVQFMQLLQSEMADEELDEFAQLMRRYRAPQNALVS